ncbi:dihydroorotate dehydrogenase [Acetatifactor aquisgranensis]|uniref:dihydroorotate dehydrogenase n=1 Tax=Acetatifactor aquisgranensis TaxID=2941233 RepID=UPI00203E297D|nr:dihydroorotate dehydrogenase [Acetatifactor aquisgranensis]MCI8542137.1 dihydroorotate dehydrogenase [Lachnospiraceae bacterium]
MNTQVTIAGVTLKNPVMTASGTFGSGMEYSEFVDLNRLGAVVTKGVANVPWPGNPTPRVAEVYGGMLNAIGLQNPGIDVFLERDIPFLKQYDTKIIVNVCGKTVEDYVDVVERLGEEQAVAMLEINVSCPNVKEGAIAFGQKADNLYDITKEVKRHARQPVIMKLSPNVTDIAEMAKAAEAAGADALSLINTITGMKIDIHKRRFALANKTGGMSGPAIKPIAVRMVYQAAHAVRIPVIGMGGIANAEDAVEFLLAGASAVSIGAMNFVDPYTSAEVVEGIGRYMEQYHVEDVTDLIGAVDR